MVYPFKYIMYIQLHSNAPYLSEYPSVFVIDTISLLRKHLSGFHGKGFKMWPLNQIDPNTRCTNIIPPFVVRVKIHKYIHIYIYVWSFIITRLCLCIFCVFCSVPFVFIMCLVLCISTFLKSECASVYFYVSVPLSFTLSLSLSLSMWLYMWICKHIVLVSSAKKEYM